MWDRGGRAGPSRSGACCAGERCAAGERERWRQAGLLGRGEKGAGLRFAGLGYWVLGFLSFISFPS